MRLILTVPDHHYTRLTDAAERRDCERTLGLALDWCRVEAMQSGGREWRRGGNGHATAEVEQLQSQPIELTELPDEALTGLTCSLSGG